MRTTPRSTGTGEKAQTPSPEVSVPPEAPAITDPSGRQYRALPLLYRFSEGHRKWFLLALLMLIVEAVMSVFEAYPIAYLIDFLQHDRGALPFPGIESPDVATITLLTSGLIVVAALHGLGDSLAEVYLARGGRRLGYSMRLTLYSHLQRLSLAFHHQRKTGDMLRRVTSDVEEVENFVLKSVSDIAGSVLVLIGTMAFLLFRAWQVALLAIVLVPILSLISNHFSHRIRATARRQRAREGELTSAAQEMLTAVPVVQTLGQSGYEQERFREHSRHAMTAALESVGLQARFSWLVGVLEALSISAVVWVGVWLEGRGRFTVGELVFFVILIQNMFKPTRKIIREWTIIGKILASVERVAEVLARKPSVSDLPDAREAPALRGELEFRNVGFGYRLDPEDAAIAPAIGEPAPLVLHDVSFHVRPGEIVALVGPSGAGKSTIAQLVPRLYDPIDGEVRTDGHDIRDFTLDSLRRQISLVLQDTILFRGTVAHNIGYGRPDATREEIVAAAVQANADEFIERMPEGYDTELSERATNLSGGQRQRISIARALIRGAPILILDEPTTGLDADSAATVLQALRRLMQGKTTIIISHDLGLIGSADRIMMISDGRIEQVGSHAELLRAGGSYASLQARRSSAPKVESEPAEPVIEQDHAVEAEGAPAAAAVHGSLDPLDPRTSPALHEELPGLAEALDGDAMGRYLQAALFDGHDRYSVTRCEPGHVSYMPGEHCVVRYRIEVRDRRGDAVSALVNGRLFPWYSSPRAYVESRLAPLADAVGDREEMAPFASPVGVVESLNMVASLFPIDGELPSLVKATDPVAMLETLRGALPDASGTFLPTRCRVDLDHYGRRHRCVLRYIVGGTDSADGGLEAVMVYGKVRADDRGALSAAVLPTLRRRVHEGNPPAFRIPRCYGFVEPLRLTLLEAIPGKPRIARLLRDELGSGKTNGHPALHGDIRAAARVAAGLHGSGIELGPARRAETELIQLEEAAAVLHRLSPQFGEEFSGWLAAASALASASEPMPSTFSHGDLTHSQLIFEGPRCGLVDFDTVCQAEPALDLGQFLTYLRVAARRAGASGPHGEHFVDAIGARFLDQYCWERYLPPAERAELDTRVRLYETVSLLRLAWHSWQKMKAPRLRSVAQLIRERLPSPTRERA